MDLDNPVHRLHCAKHGSALCAAIHGLSFASLALQCQTKQSVDRRTKHRSMVCAAQSMDCPNPRFAPNIYMFDQK